MPAFAGHYLIKKWAAVVALLASAFYLALSGAEVATQRSFIMVAIVLIGVMIDRPTLTLRTLTVAALGVLLIAPESIVHPSFQMSFAATLALVAGYQQGVPWTVAGAETPLGARIALFGGREILGLVLVSLLAGTATMPYVAFHFHRLAPYGVLANLLAMPVVSLWVMPLGIVALLALPFGLDGSLWWLMGEGIAWMIAVAVWVTGLPGAVGRMASFGTGPLLLCSAGLVVLCLLRTWLRLVGPLLMCCAVVWAIRTPQPDVLITADASAIAVRGADGRLAMFRTGSNAFAFREWLSADADARAPTDKGLGDNFRCDAVGCTANLADGSVVAIVKSAEAFEEDCRRAVLVVSGRDAPPGCAALVIDRQASRRSGAVALRRVDGVFKITPARSGGYDRPWSPATAQPRETAETTRSGLPRQPPARRYAARGRSRAG